MRRRVTGRLFVPVRALASAWYVRRVRRVAAALKAEGVQGAPTTPGSEMTPWGLASVAVVELCPRRVRMIDWGHKPAPVEEPGTDDFDRSREGTGTSPTGGWSGNEEIVEAMGKNFLWHVAWVSSRRGGHYVFEVVEAGAYVAKRRSPAV